ncbi:MAG: hypothetical protein RLZZ318_412, partial [Bacteroidota bacterium]
MSNATIHSNLNPLDSMMKRFDEAAKILNLDDSVYNTLKYPARIVTVHLPVMMD